MNAPQYGMPRDEYVYQQFQDMQKPVYVIPVQKPKPAPYPRGRPDRGLFIAGGVGMFIAAALAICLGIFNILSTPYIFFGGYFTGGNAIISLILGILFYVGLLLGLFGFYGFYKNYGSNMGIAAFGFGIIATTFFLISQIISAIAYSSYNYPYYPPSIWAIIFTIIGMILIGVLFILEGVSFMTARHFSNIGELNLTAGIMFVISGAFFCSLFLGLLGGFFLFASVAIMAGIVFVKSPIPVIIIDQTQPQGTRTHKDVSEEVNEGSHDETHEENRKEITKKSSKKDIKKI